MGSQQLLPVVSVAEQTVAAGVIRGRQAGLGERPDCAACEEVAPERCRRTTPNQSRIQVSSGKGTLSQVCGISHPWDGLKLSVWMSADFRRGVGVVWGGTPVPPKRTALFLQTRKPTFRAAIPRPGRWRDRECPIWLREAHLGHGWATWWSRWWSGSEGEGDLTRRQRPTRSRQQMTSLCTRF